MLFGGCKEICEEVMLDAGGATAELCGGVVRGGLLAVAQPGGAKTMATVHQLGALLSLLLSPFSCKYKIQIYRSHNRRKHKESDNERERVALLKAPPLQLFIYPLFLFS